MHRFALLVASATLVGCAAVSSPTPSEMVARAVATFAGRDALVYHVPSSSPFFAAGRIARLAVDPERAPPTLVKILQ
jgi:hypothetical protein